MMHAEQSLRIFLKKLLVGQGVDLLEHRRLGLSILETLGHKLRGLLAMLLPEHEVPLCTLNERMTEFLVEEELGALGKGDNVERQESDLALKPTAGRIGTEILLMTSHDLLVESEVPW